MSSRLSCAYDSLNGQWVVGVFAFHIMLYGPCDKKTPEFVARPAPDASSDSVPPVPLILQTPDACKISLPAVSIDSAVAIANKTRHVFVTGARFHVLHPFFSSLDLSSFPCCSAGASPFNMRFSVFLMVSFVLSSSFFSSLSSACCLF